MSDETLARRRHHLAVGGAAIILFLALLAFQAGSGAAQSAVPSGTAAPASQAQDPVVPPRFTPQPRRYRGPRGGGPPPGFAPGDGGPPPRFAPGADATPPGATPGERSGDLAVPGTTAAS